MTDKKHINDLLKNPDKNFNENCTHDKEQIIIDGCNVLECEHYQYKSLKDCEMRYPESGDCEIGLLNYLFNGNLDIEKFCKDNPNCYFKQLARKTQECEELKKANQHIDTNRQCKGSKLKRIEELISDCETGYTDEFIQKIYGIIQEPEPTVNDYSITDRYREALEEIEKVTKINCEEICGRKFEDCNDFLCSSKNILDIINKAKGGGECQ